MNDPGSSMEGSIARQSKGASASKPSEFHLEKFIKMNYYAFLQSHLHHIQTDKSISVVHYNP